jgi:hypothetical protein
MFESSELFQIGLGGGAKRGKLEPVGYFFEKRVYFRSSPVIFFTGLFSHCEIYLQWSYVSREQLFPLLLFRF